jgi:23S rRNA pseudouridine1911/1915/1917 synthase
MKIDIIYEDNHILVVKKPINILSQSDRTEDNDMLSLLKKDIKKRHKKPGNVYLGLVHRLDRPAGGLMVFAKTSKAAGRLSENIRNRTFKKTYLIVVKGMPDYPEGTLKHYLKKDRITNMVDCFPKPKQGYKEAILEYEVLESKKDKSLIKVNLITGRSHQIRVQFSSIGNHVYGDMKYGGAGEKGRQLALWSYKVGFEHPVSKEIMQFTLCPDRTKPWSLFNINEI